MITVETRVYYNKDGYSVRDVLPFDSDYMSNNLRQSDIDEVWASHHLSPKDAVAFSEKYSDMCFVITKDELPFAMFGCTPVEDKGVVWVLGTDGIEKCALEFVRYSKYFIGLMLEKHSVLYNYVDARNTKSILWLKRIGAVMEGPQPYGIEQKPFMKFEFKRS